MRYQVPLECDRPQPIYFAAIEAAGDDEAQRQVTEQRPGERLLVVRQDGGRLAPVPPATRIAD
jgi:hypothetical protein